MKSEGRRQSEGRQWYVPQPQHQPNYTHGWGMRP
jgi:hypothetical protein